MLTRRVVFFFFFIFTECFGSFGSFLFPAGRLCTCKKKRAAGPQRLRGDYLAAPAPCAASAAPSPSTGSSSGIPKALLYACTALKRLL